MRTGGGWILALAAAAAIGTASQAAASGAETPGGEGSPATPVSSVLRPDGTLDLTTGFSGSLDVSGFSMVTAPDGAPRFVPADASAATPRTPGPLPPPVRGPESDPGDIYWDDQFPVPGASGYVYAAVADGQGNFYIGGTFLAAGNVAANYIAKWDGVLWSAPGGGTNHWVYALAVSGGDLYAGGSFTAAGGVSPTCQYRLRHWLEKFSEWAEKRQDAQR